MGDACVVCGEVVEGKPLYKKLGSGEFNVEVITALHALEIISLPENAKNENYICWDCDEVIVGEYDSFLKTQDLKKAEAARQKQAKKQQRAQQKKKLQAQSVKLFSEKVQTTAKKQKSWSSKQPEEPPPQLSKNKSEGISKTKKLELQRASNVYHSAHCVMCDSNFETDTRGYQRYPLKKRVNDDMDIAQVMEFLGMARYIEPKMKGRRFVCNPCFIIIRRSYKNKLAKGSSIAGSSVAEANNVPSAPSQKSFHRATTEEHAAEIAKLLPPALAECYKILTSDSVTQRTGDGVSNSESASPTVSQKTGSDVTDNVVKEATGNVPDKISSKTGGVTDSKESVTPNSNTVPSSPQANGQKSDKPSVPPPEDNEERDSESEEEEEDRGLNLSQDEHGNYFIDMDIMTSPRAGDDREYGSDTLPKDEAVASFPAPKKKTNVMLPKRSHNHLTVNRSDSKKRTETLHASQTEAKTKERESKKVKPEVGDSGICNICGRSFTGKSQDFWHTLTSPLSGFESITVTVALKLLETSLADTSKEARDAQQVCLPCYGMVSSGFKSQVVQRIARQKNVDTSQVNISKVKVRMLPKDDLSLTVEKPAKEDKKALGDTPEEAVDAQKENIISNSKKNLKRKHTSQGQGSKKKKLGEGIKNKIENIGAVVNEVSLPRTRLNKGGIYNKIRRSLVDDDLSFSDAEKTSSDEESRESLDSRRAVQRLGKKSSKRKRSNADAVCAEDIVSDEDSDPVGSRKTGAYVPVPKSKSVLSAVNQSRSKSTPSTVSSSHSKSGLSAITSPRTKPGDKPGLHSKPVSSSNTSIISKPNMSAVVDTLEKLSESSDSSLDSVETNNNNWNDKVTLAVPGKKQSASSVKARQAKQKVSEGSNSSKPVVILKDLKFVLPSEAFGGKAVSASKIEDNIDQETSSDDDSSSSPENDSFSDTWNSTGYASAPMTSEPGAQASPLQIVFNTVSAAHHENEARATPASASTNKPGEKDVGGTDSSMEMERGRCVVCGCNYEVRKSFWHTIGENIRPPTLMVGIRWVCLSLNVVPVQLSQRDRDHGKVCRHCFVRLGNQFEKFVKTKVGESCGLEAKAVDLSEYTISFNSSTMNIEADPKQHSYVQEFEDTGQLLLKILPVVQSFSIDDVVGKCHRQPLSPQDYTVWLLLVLNDLRIQIGAGIKDLAEWLVRLMPRDLFSQGLRPCHSALASFLLSITKFSDTLTEDKLNAAIPSEVFVVDSQSLRDGSSTSNIQTESSKYENTKSDQVQLIGQSDWLSYVETNRAEKDELSWEDFLAPINMDSLLKGNAKRLTKTEFNKGVQFALWKVSQILGLHEDVVLGWLRQLSPVPLQKDQVTQIFSAVSSFHLHLEKYPDDVPKLRSELTVQLLSSDGSPRITPDGQWRRILQKANTDKANSTSLETCSAAHRDGSVPVSLQKRETEKRVRQRLAPTGVKKRGRPRKQRQLPAQSCETPVDSGEEGTGKCGGSTVTSAGEPSTHQDGSDRTVPHRMSKATDKSSVVIEKRTANKFNTCKAKDSVKPRIEQPDTKSRRDKAHKSTRLLAESNETTLDNSEEGFSGEGSHSEADDDSTLGDISDNRNVTSSTAKVIGKSVDVYSDRKIGSKLLSKVKQTNTTKVKSYSTAKHTKISDCSETDLSDDDDDADEGNLHNGGYGLKPLTGKKRSSTGIKGTSTGKQRITQERVEDTGEVEEDIESESLQLSSKLLSKVQQLETQLNEIRKHNEQLIQVNEKLVGIHVDKRQHQTYAEQQVIARRTMQSIEEQLSTILSTDNLTPLPLPTNSPLSSSKSTPLSCKRKVWKKIRREKNTSNEKAKKLSEKIPKPLATTKLELREKNPRVDGEEVSDEQHLLGSPKPPEINSPEPEGQPKSLKQGNVPQFTKDENEGAQNSKLPQNCPGVLAKHTALDRDVRSKSEDDKLELSVEEKDAISDKRNSKLRKSVDDEKDERGSQGLEDAAIHDKSQSESRPSENCTPVQGETSLCVDEPVKVTGSQKLDVDSKSSVVNETPDKLEGHSMETDSTNKSIENSVTGSGQSDKSSTKQRSSQKKPKLRFEDFMNYDSGALKPP